MLLRGKREFYIFHTLCKKNKKQKSAINEAERIVDLKTGTIDIAGKKMKTPHPGANLKWMKPEAHAPIRLTERTRFVK